MTTLLLALLSPLAHADDSPRQIMVDLPPGASVVVLVVPPQPEVPEEAPAEQDEPIPPPVKKAEIPIQPAGTDILTVRIPPGIYASQLDVSCPKANSYHARATFVNGIASVPHMPLQTTCTLRFMGGGITSRVVLEPTEEVRLRCTTMNTSTLVCR